MPVIKFDENGGKPKEPQRLGTAGTFKTPVDLSDTGYIDGELKYTFTVENDSDAARQRQLMTVNFTWI